MNEKKIKIGSLLMQYGLITEEDLNEGLKLQKLMGLKLGETLAKIGKITEENIQWVLSKQFDIPFIIVEHVEIDKDLIMKLPKDFLIQNKILPLFEAEDEICIVTDNIFNYSAFAFIENALYKKVNVSICEGKKIEQALMKFYKKEAVPSLLSILHNIIEKIKNTSFYRIDIALIEHKCEISIYGCGILKKVSTINNSIKKEDVLRAFDSINIPFLYNVCDNFSKVLFSVYPLINKIDDIRYPAVLGINGLILPDDTAFSDMQSSDIPHLLCCNSPIYGYPYISIRGRKINYNKMIYTVDSAPEDFQDYYVKIYAPKKCLSCNCEGCEKCDELGYTFEKIEGSYNADDLKKTLMRI